MGIPIPKTQVIWASPFHITLPIWAGVRVRVTEDAQKNKVWKWGWPKGGDDHITVTPVLPDLLKVWARLLNFTCLLAMTG